MSRDVIHEERDLSSTPTWPSGTIAGEHKSSRYEITSTPQYPTQVEDLSPAPLDR